VPCSSTSWERCRSSATTLGDTKTEQRPVHHRSVRRSEELPACCERRTENAEAHRAWEVRPLVRNIAQDSGLNPPAKPKDNMSSRWPPACERIANCSHSAPNPSNSSFKRLLHRLRNQMKDFHTVVHCERQLCNIWSQNADCCLGIRLRPRPPLNVPRTVKANNFVGGRALGGRNQLSPPAGGRPWGPGGSVGVDDDEIAAGPRGWLPCF
jgi:hypothetical protein